MSMQNCKQCGTPFEVTADDLEFLEKVSPIYLGKQELIPPPTLCSDCRQQRRWAFQNQRYLYHRTSSATGKDIIAAYSEEKPMKVYEKQEWQKVDNTDLGKPFDFSRSFFEQFAALFAETPKAAVLQTGEMINSDYTHFAGWLKNTYLIFDAGKCEDCMYGTFIGYCKNCVDILDMLQNELCYDCVDLTDCYSLLHATFCRNCSFSAYLFDCVGCKHCIGCINLRSAEYHVFNKPVGKEEFERVWREVCSGSFLRQEQFEEQWKQFAVQCPRRPVHNINAQSSTGDYLVNCENCQHCYKCFELRDAKHCQYVFLKSNDLQDVSSFGESMEFCYELSASGGMTRKIGMSSCCFNAYLYYGGNNVYYSIHCHENCSNCFGCCDVRGKRYCILNKQHTQGEYEALVPRIIEHMRKDGEWGEFFPMSISPFCYNETVAQDYFPLTKEQVLSQGLRWKEHDKRAYRKQKTELPDSVTETLDGITQEVLACVTCGKNYKIVAQELAFYREIGLPLPRLCPDCRYVQRIARRNPQKLWQRNCAKCSKEIQTSYAPDRHEIVYCEECYLKAVY